MSISPEQLYDWLKNQAWPLWLQYGVDWQAGAFHESLTLDGYHATSDFRRLRVLARQIYVFSQAHHHGVKRADEAVELGLAYLARHARQNDGGYASRFSLQGAVIDNKRDLYDHAFVLLALSTAATVGNAATLRHEALQLDKFINTSLRHAHAGYLEQLPPLLPRRQNPHMHLLEAYLAAAEQFKDPLFLERADSLISLFKTQLFCSATGTLPEYFDESWQIKTIEGRHIWEPGHHCEWVWLLDWYERLRGSNGLAPLRQALWKKVTRSGFDTTHGILINEVWSDGTPKDAGHRLWPQTERLKAEWLMQATNAAQPMKSTSILLSFLRPDGLWQEHKSANRRPENDVAPASSLYHLTCGILFLETMINKK